MCRSRRCLLLVTQSYINSVFFQVELNDALDRQCRLGLVFCLPVYYQLGSNLRPYQLRDMPVFDYHSDEFWQKLEPAIKSEAFRLHIASFWRHENAYHRFYFFDLTINVV